VLRSALDFYRQTVAVQQLESNYFAAMAQYQLAVIVHRQFEAVPLRYPEEQMGKDLEQKSELFLLAQGRYHKVIDEYPNEYWITASAFQIGLMYEEFWDDWMMVPMPAGLSAAAAKEYVKLLNELPALRALLEKSLEVHEKNVLVARRNGIQTGWVAESSRHAARVKDLLNRQSKGELFMPGKLAADPARSLKPDDPGTGSGEGGEQGDYIPTRTNL
jgi:hypothetical protein